ncbi:MAG: FtsX-like permease family protein [Candidatus Bathyarchaeota archaeon]|nr:FtsX-like permease family protein [Candidatus Bathyarchaeum sp.]
MFKTIRNYAIKEIKKRKLRSTASIIGYVIAVTFLIVTVTFAQSYNVEATSQLNQIGTHFVVYTPESIICPCHLAIDIGPFFKSAYTYTFDSDLVEKVSTLAGVLDAAPCLMFRLDNLTICGVDYDSLATQTNVVNAKTLVVGNYSKVNDSGAVLIDSVYAGVTGLTVGDSLNAFDQTFTVVGIVNPSVYSKPAGIASMYAPLDVVQEIGKHYARLYLFEMDDINVVLVEMSSEGNSTAINSLEKDVLETLNDYTGEIGTVVGYQCSTAARKVISVTTESAWAISIVLLICMTLFALKSQFGSVVERTREIGILKAIGWADSDITKQVFLESLLQGVAGGIIGVGLSYFIIFLIPSLNLVSTQNLVLTISPILPLVGLVFSISGGILAGIFPAWRAAKLQPAEALRHL